MRRTGLDAIGCSWLGFKKVRDFDMKLSEAILLGSTVLAPRAGGQHFSETQEGCALGMAAIARGCSFHQVATPFAEKDRRTLGAEGVWGPWMLKEVPRPCDCWRIWIRRKMRIKEVIAHLFDYHVMVKKNWTLERLVAWVETVEPREVQPAMRPRPHIVPPSNQHNELLIEASEWRAVRHAFEERYRKNQTGAGLARSRRDAKIP
jgi:hypothetical protein